MRVPLQEREATKEGIIRGDNQQGKLHIPFVHEAISEVARTWPERTAISYYSQTLSYQQLELLSNKLANCFIMEGVTVESKIGLCMESGPAMAVALLGILKAGAAYVPLMPTLPAQRIETIVNDANAVFVVTDARQSTSLSTLSTKLFPFDLDEWSAAEGDEKYPQVDLQPENAAYVLYTSGSTGLPKGVVIEHRNLSYYLQWTITQLLKTNGARLPLTSSMSFAAGVTQFYSPLLQGECLHILPTDIIRQPEHLLSWYAAHKGYGIYCVPTLWNAILSYIEEHPSTIDNAPICVFLSGEAIPEILPEKTFNLIPAIKMWNLYGPTEAVANLTATELFRGKPISIGKPLQGTHLFIVKEDGTACDTGETGELLASGAGIAREYLGRPELTDVAFISYNSSEYGPVRAYRTGDLVRIDESGQLLYQGRLDQQVKIRGYRIELMEVEQALKQVRGVQQAVVKAHKPNEIENILLAYVVTVTGQHLSIPFLRQELAKTLPDYMIPERWMFLNELPTLANGKVNRKQLPAPNNPRPELGYAPLYPTSSEEQKIVQLFEDALGINGLGIHDNFFDLGGTSLKINAIIHGIRKEFGKIIAYRSLFDHPTPALLLEVVKNNQSDKSYTNSLQSVQVPAPNQTGMWFFEQTHAGNTSYHIPYSIRLNGAKNIQHIQQALQAIVGRHLSLRSCFPVTNGLPTLHIKEHLHAELPFSDLSYMQEAEALQQAYQSIEHLSLKPFDLAQAPLFRFHLYMIAENDYVLGIVIHHIIFDGWSVNVFHKEFVQYYHLLQTGQYAQPAQPEVNYLHFAGHYQQYENTTAYKDNLTFWNNQLAGAAGQTLLPNNFISSQSKKNAGGRISFCCSSEDKQRLLQLSKEYNVTPFLILLSGLYILLQRYTDEEDILIGTPVANRNEAGYYPLIGYFVNTLMLRLRAKKSNSFTKLLEHIKATCLESFEHSAMPFDKQLRILREQSPAGQAANIHILFAYHEAFEQAQAVSGLETLVHEHFNHSSKLPIFLECQDIKDDSIRFALTYDSNLYHEQSMIQLMQYYTVLLQEIIKDPSLPITEYTLQASGAKAQLLAANNSRQYAGSHLLHQIFEQTADAYPNQIAVKHDHHNFTYRELDDFSNILAWRLKEKGFSVGDSAGIFMEHSPGMAAAMLAVMKCGGCYVPLDPAYPEKRNSYVITHAGLKFVLLEEGMKHMLPNAPTEILEVNPYLKTSGNVNKQRPSVSFDTDTVLYTMYTSGSTGNPKGVVVPHKGVCNYLYWMKECFEVSHTDRILAKTSISFDISVWELFLPLICGGTTVLADRTSMKSAEYMAELIQNEGVSIAQFVPSGLKAFADAQVLSHCSTLKKIFCGGEQLPVSLQQEVLTQFKGELHNLYGPTEASIFMCHWQCSLSHANRTVPIGKPIPNSYIYVLDNKLNPVPAGITGELYIGGDILAKGYLHNKQQTDAAFIPSPFKKGSFIYKTGDLGRYIHDGNVEFLGRVDHQVKVRGYRIELGEIEQLLYKIEGVKAAVVCRKEYSEDDVRLLAYIVLHRGISVREAEIRSYLKTYLPEYMIPSACYLIDSIPTLPNGKTDLKTLTAIIPMRNEEAISTHHFRDDVEKILAGIWEEVLGHRDFKLTDNFMDAGGHSILLVKVCELINEKLDENYSLLDLFQYPSIQSFAKQYREKYSAAPKQAVQDNIAKRKNKISEMKKRFNKN